MSTIYYALARSRARLTAAPPSGHAGGTWLWLFVLAAAGVCAASCDWPYENPVDPARCEDGCPKGKVCYGGACVASLPADGGVGRPCKQAAECGDKLDCTTDTCANSRCVNTPQKGKCAIGGVCFTQHDTNKNNPCQVCDPSQSSTAWTLWVPCVSTLAGKPEAGDGQGYTDGPAHLARFDYPRHVAALPGGGVLVADAGNHCIREVKNGKVSTFAGKCTVSGNADGHRTNQARFKLPSYVAVGPDGTVFVSEEGRVDLRRLNKDQVATMIVKGVKTSWGVAICANGTRVTTDPDSHRLQVLVKQLALTLGTGISGFTNGAGTQAQFSSPQGLACVGSDAVLVADRYNHVIRRVSLGAGYAVSTLAGSGKTGFLDGLNNKAAFNDPVDVVVDAYTSDIYVVDRDNHAVRWIWGGEVSTEVGGVGKDMPGPGYRDGHHDIAQFRYPEGIAINAAGDLVVADTGNHRIRLLKL